MKLLLNTKEIYDQIEEFLALTSQKDDIIIIIAPSYTVWYVPRAGSTIFWDEISPWCSFSPLYFYFVVSGLDLIQGLFSIGVLVPLGIAGMNVELC